MSYKLELTRQAHKHLKKNTGKDHRRIVCVLQAMRAEPFEGDVIKLTGHNAYRRRVGNYHILFSVDEQTVVVLVFDILRRNEKTYT